MMLWRAGTMNESDFHDFRNQFPCAELQVGGSQAARTGVPFHDARRWIPPIVGTSSWPRDLDGIDFHDRSLSTLMGKDWKGDSRWISAEGRS